MKGLTKRVIASILSFIMVITMVFPMQAYAGALGEEPEIETEGLLSFSEENTYAFVYDGKALSVKSTSWQKPLEFTFVENPSLNIPVYLDKDVAIIAENGKAIRIDDNSVKANGTVEEIVDGDGKVKVTNNDAGAIYSGSGSQNASGLNEGSWEGFSITEADEEGKFYITTFSGAYFKVNAETSEIETTTEQTEAAIFTFKEIGETVKKHITHIFEKLGIENRKEIKQIDKHFES